MSKHKVLAHSLLSKEDIYLFNEGKHYQIHQKLGSHPLSLKGESGVYFAVYAPAAQKVELIGNFNHWQGENHPLNVRWDGSGIWEGFIAGLAVGDLYKYRITSAHQEQVLEKADPYARQAEHPPKTASVVSEAAYQWQDAAWEKHRLKANSLQAPLSVYEMHLGSWRKKDGEFLSYRQLAKELVPYLQKLGFTHVEFMPIMEFPYDPSWGYQIVSYFAPTSRFGSPADFKYLVDQLHQAGIGVILDWVPSHFPEDAHGLGNFDGSCVYEHPDKRRGYHPDWKSLIFNYGRPQVKSFLISNALYWLEEFHIDGLRVDAVASMLYLDYSRNEGEWEPNQYGGNENLEAIAFIKDFNAAVHQYHPHVLTIAEESTSFNGVTRPVQEGGLGFHLKWMMGWMNDNLEYFKRNPIYRQHHHNEITFSLAYAFTERFMLPLSHDEVVYGKKSLLERMPGDDWQTFANLRLLYSWMFLHPGAKLIFMGGEFGQRAEWDFAGQLNWEESGYEAHQGIAKTLTQLNALYRQEPALHARNYENEGFEWIELNDAQNSVISFIRQSEKEELVCVLNLTPVPHEKFAVGVNQPGSYQEIFNSDHTEFWGSGLINTQNLKTETQTLHGRMQTLSISVPPLGAVVFKKL